MDQIKLQDTFTWTHNFRNFCLSNNSSWLCVILSNRHQCTDFVLSVLGHLLIGKLPFTLHTIFVKISFTPLLKSNKVMCIYYLKINIKLWC